MPAEIKNSSEAEASRVETQTARNEERRYTRPGRLISLPLSENHALTKSSCSVAIVIKSADSSTVKMATRVLVFSAAAEEEGR
jgi:hypothetical protein